ncbi:hypothetical protein [Cryobacterium sp. MLB-32]|uniref:hypothetical protein n=1 Tax=Cryobacterium sp. MLB-32 TaxID=1529318 RepID=UPI0012E09AB3|nr:hypothetical protein [Cryobacterium sp. MLB-32]
MAVAVALAVGTTGCAGMPGFQNDIEAPVAAVVDGVDCQAPNLGGWVLPDTARPTDAPEHPDAPAPGRVPHGFVPDAAYRCSFMASFEDEKGRWSAVTVDRLEGDFGPLLHALSAPDDRFGFTQACTADMPLVPELWLQNAAGEAVRVAWPRDACLKTKPAALAALERLTLKDSDTLRVRLVESRAALDGGCVMTYAAPAQRALLQRTMSVDVVPAAPGATPEPSAAAAGRPTTPSWAGVDGVDACLYTAEPEQEPVDGGSFPEREGLIAQRAGGFTGATTLATDVAARLLVAASTSERPAPPCETEVTRFAVLWPERYESRIDAPITVELDGCGRLHTPGYEALVTPPELLETLAAL